MPWLVTAHTSCITGLAPVASVFVDAKSATGARSAGAAVNVPATGAEILSLGLVSKRTLLTSTCTNSQ